VQQISGGHRSDKCKRFQEVTTEISGKDIRRSPQRLVEGLQEVTTDILDSKWKRFQKVTTEISRRDFRKSPQR
jgi:hypothetical protein